MEEKTTMIAEIFGKNVFNDAVMEKRLPKKPPLYNNPFS